MANPSLKGLEQKLAHANDKAERRKKHIQLLEMELKFARQDLAKAKNWWRLKCGHVVEVSSKWNVPNTPCPTCQAEELLARALNASPHAEACAWARRGDACNCWRRDADNLLDRKVASPAPPRDYG